MHDRTAGVRADRGIGSAARVDSARTPRRPACSLRTADRLTSSQTDRRGKERSSPTRASIAFLPPSACADSPTQPARSLPLQGNAMKTLSALVALISPWVAGASQTCTFPPSDSGVAPTDARLDRPFTCMPGSQDPTTKSTESTIDGPIPGHMYVDAKTTLYDMSPVASFIDGDDVKAAVIPRSTSTDALAAMLKQAQAEGAEIALLTEEDFGFGDAGESLSGPHITAVASTAKDLGMYVVCPFRMQLSPGESYNGAVVIGRNGTILRAANSGIDHYEKVFPVLGWPLGPLSQSSPGGDKEAFSVQQVKAFEPRTRSCVAPSLINLGLR